jgi:hypothetical protein
VRLCYAKQYANCQPVDILQLSPQKRLNVMKSLTALSRYLGCYDSWQQTRKQYNLKWTTGNESLQSLERFFNPDLTIDVMLSKVRGMMAALPARMAAVVKFACLTGLRPSEAVESARLLNALSAGTRSSYYNQERQALEHFRFPEIFIRRTKKAYISFVTKEQLSGIGLLRGKTPSWNSIRLACRRVGVGMEMHLCRKIFASHLSQLGIQSEVIDFLQGRVSTSVFSRHYLTPGAGLKDRILRAVEELARQL